MNNRSGSLCHVLLDFALRTATSHLVSRRATVALTAVSEVLGILADPVSPGRGPIELSSLGVGLGNPIVTESVGGTLNVSMIEALLQDKVKISLAWLPVVRESGGALARPLPGSSPVRIGSTRFGGLSVQFPGHRVRCCGQRVRCHGHRVRLRGGALRPVTGHSVLFRGAMQGIAVGSSAAIHGDQAEIRERVDMARCGLGTHLTNGSNPVEPGETQVGGVPVLVGQNHQYQLAKRVADVLAYGPGHGAHAHRPTPESGLGNARVPPMESTPLLGRLDKPRH